MAKRLLTPEQYLAKTRRKPIAQAIFDGKSNEYIVAMGYTEFSIIEEKQKIAALVGGNVVICSACDPKSGLCLEPAAGGLSDVTSESVADGETLTPMTAELKEDTVTTEAVETVAKKTKKK